MPMPDGQNLVGLRRVIHAFLTAEAEHSALTKDLIHDRTLWEEPIGGETLRVLSAGPADRDVNSALRKLIHYLGQKAKTKD